MHNDTKLGNRLSSKLTTVRLSAGALGFRGAAGFLNGSVPDALAQAWHRKPGPGFAAMVYLVCQALRFERVTDKKHAYHCKLFLALCASFKAADGWLGIRPHRFRQSRVRILLVVVVIAVVFAVFLAVFLGLFLRSRFKFGFGSFGELSLFVGRLFCSGRFIQLIGRIARTL
jgi:hypothetical protein